MKTLVQIRITMWPILLIMVRPILKIHLLTQTFKVISYIPLLCNPLWECQHCQASMWYQDRNSKHKQTYVLKFQLRCKGSKVVLPLMRQPPPLSHQLLFDRINAHSKKFQANIRTYNIIFSFISPGMKFDTIYSKGHIPHTLQLHGQTCY